MKGTFVIAGETYLALETVAECFDCEVAWVERVYALGLLGRGEMIEGRVAIPAASLERVATVRRLCVHLDLSPELVGLWLDEE